jgi:TPR repeat protein
MYATGRGVTQDYKQAVYWYTKAAEQGFAAAQYNLGVMYANGQGVIQDDKQAVNWYKKAAEQGYASAQSTLGFMYYNGQGVLQDKVYAHMWYNISASNGNDDAPRNRDIVAKELTPSQLEKSQDLARACVAKNYKGC